MVSRKRSTDMDFIPLEGFPAEVEAALKTIKRLARAGWGSVGSKDGFKALDHELFQ